MQLKTNLWWVTTLRQLVYSSQSTTHVIQLVELKNGETFNGHLVNCDNFMNITLREVYQTSAEADRFWKLKECYIRGSTVRIRHSHLVDWYTYVSFRLNIYVYPISCSTVWKKSRIVQERLAEVIGVEADHEVRYFYDERNCCLYLWHVYRAWIAFSW